MKCEQCGKPYRNDEDEMDIGICHSCEISIGDDLPIKEVADSFSL